VNDDDEVVEVTWPWPGFEYFGCVVEPEVPGQPVFSPADFEQAKTT